MLGRAEDYELKGLDIAAAAVAEACGNFRRKGQNEIILLVRGAPEHTSGELMSQLKSHCGGRDLDIRIRPFDPAQNIIEADLMEASLLLMPSRTDGFGLVALEAISMGTPVLVSDQSGIGKWLSEWMKREMSDLPPVVVATSDDRASSVSTWAPAIERVLQDPALSLQRARTLAARLAKAHTWQSAAELLRKALRSAN